VWVRDGHLNPKPKLCMHMGSKQNGVHEQFSTHNLPHPLDNVTGQLVRLYPVWVERTYLGWGGDVVLVYCSALQIAPPPMADSPVD
jgi:hypothetical protein